MHNVTYITYFWLQSKGGLHRYVFKTVLTCFLLLIDTEHMFSLCTHGFKKTTLRTVLY